MIATPSIARPLILLLLLGAAHCRAYVSVGEGWDGPGRNPHVIQYYFGAIPQLTGASPEAVKSAFQTAMRAWSDATAGNLVFAEVYSANQPNTIDIVWIDEPGHFADNAVAHSYYASPPNPEPHAGDIHLNPLRPWATGIQAGPGTYQVERVAAHEIGHALGMDHAMAAPAVMAGTIRPGEIFSGLSADDIDGICDLYLCTQRTPAPAPLALLGLYGLAHARRWRQRQW